MNRFVVTIAREYCSGGQKIGQRLADELGVNCYNSEMFRLVSNNENMKDDEVSHDDRIKDTSLYDVANLDGANRLQKIRHNAWPAIKPTTTVILIMNAGSVMNADFTKILLMQNQTNTSKLEVIATFVYHEGIGSGNFEYATAVNLFASVISFILVYSTNLVVRRINPEDSLW